MAHGIEPNFVLKHWQGYFPLGVAFWLIFIAISLCYYAFEYFVRIDLLAIPAGFGPVIAYLLLTRFVVFPWQIVGLMRSCDKYFLRYGGMLRVRTVQGMILVSLAVNGVAVIDNIQWVIARESQAANSAYLKQGDAYALTVNRRRQLIHLDGELAFGITADMKTKLAEESQIQGIVLNSVGGMIVEGRGLFMLLDRYKLDTYVYQECSSACAMAFIGGRNRYLGKNGKLGFHQYALERSVPALKIDISEQMQRDKKYFQIKQIDPRFIDRIFDKPSHSIWYPHTAELLEAGVVTARIEEP